MDNEGNARMSQGGHAKMVNAPYGAPDASGAPVVAAPPQQGAKGPDLQNPYGAASMPERQNPYSSAGAPVSLAQQSEAQPHGLNEALSVQVTPSLYGAPPKQSAGRTGAGSRRRPRVQLQSDVSSPGAAAAPAPANSWITGIDARAARNAIVMSEIIGPPVSKRRRKKY